MSNTRAVIVGIDAYPNLPGGDLRGAGFDAVRWARFCVEHLQIASEGVSVLCSSPDAVSAAWPDLQTAPATLGRFVQQVVELGQWIRSEHAEGREATGIVVFSGHGATTAEHNVVQGDRLSLCMQDARIDDGELLGAVPLKALDTALDAQGVATHVTFIVDACYRTLVAESVAAVPALIQDLIPANFRTDEDSFVPRVRLLLGASEWDAAYESCIDGHWRGVFSFALLTVLSQWRRAERDGVVSIRGTYQEVLFRARAVMQAMGYARQQPQLSGALRAPMVPFNFPSLESAHNDACPIPDGNRYGREISGDSDVPGVWKFEFATPSLEKTFAAVLAGQVGSGFPASVVAHGHPIDQVPAQAFAMYSSTNINAAVTHASSCTLTSSQATEAGGEYVVDLSDLVGNVSLTHGPSGQTHAVSWHSHYGTGPEPSQGPAFGPYSMSITDGSTTIIYQGYVHFHVSAGQVNGVQFWVRSGVQPQGSIQLPSGFDQQGALFAPGAAQSWYHSDVDSLIPV